MIAHLLYDDGENGSNGERNMQSTCQTSIWLTTYRSSLCIRARPCHLTFPLSLILPTLLATRYWFFILLNIVLPLIEFTPGYQIFKEASPPFTVLPGSSPPLRMHTRNLPSSSSSCVFLPEREDMEIDNTCKKEICVSSNLDKNQEQQRWVWGCFNFFPPRTFKMIDNREYWVIYVMLKYFPNYLYYVLQVLL